MSIDNKVIVEVLAVLEALEAEQINVGIYSTQITLDILHRAINGRKREAQGIELSLDELQGILRLLVKQEEVIQWRSGYFRSRIAETVRVLRLVRQRFWGQRTVRDMFNNAPLLIEDIRVEFRRRRKPKLNIDFESAIPSGVPSAIKKAFLDAVGFEKVRAFQARAINDIFACARQGNTENLSFIVAGDTGAGKTEAFFFPILLDIASEPDELRTKMGVRAVLVYPRIRLARNQLGRLLRYTINLKDNGGPSVTLGIQNGDVPDSVYALQDKGWKHKVRDGRHFYQVDLLEQCVKCKAGHYWVDSQDPALDTGCPSMVCDNCSHVLDTLYITQAALRKGAPDILIITDVSLSQWLAREQYSHLWGLWERDALQNVAEPTVPPRFLVLDEVHLYEQLKGAHVARLIKRFQARVRLVYTHRGEQHHHPIVIGVSATLQNERTFLAKLMDVEAVENNEQYKRLRCIKPDEKRDELELTDGRERYIFIYPRSLSPTQVRPEYRVNDQAAAIQIVMTCMHNLMKDNKAWRGLAFFDSINDLRQFRHDYDAPNSFGPLDTDGRRLPPANQDELWRIRTDRKKVGRAGRVEKSVENACGSECAIRLHNATLDRCPHFLSGDCWVFAKVHGANRQLRVADSVYAGAKDAAALDDKDLIPTSPSLEVGYDDDAIQLVYQHKAPSNAASFIQRRGRAGRNVDDSPIIVTLLWPYRRDDAFYFFRPEALYAPTFDDVPLNAGNFMVQRTHTLLAFFDLLACWRRQNLNNILAEPWITDFTRAGKHYFPLGPGVLHSIEWIPDRKSPGQNRLVVQEARERKLLYFRGKQLESIQVNGNTLAIIGWLAMSSNLLPHVLRPAWEKLALDGSIDHYIESADIASSAFRSHHSYPFYIHPVSGASKLPTRLLNQFGKKDYHSSKDQDRNNWLKTYRYIDWMLQGNQEATTLTVHYPNPERGQAQEPDERTIDVTFALTELLPGNVSYRLREPKEIHWTPVPANETSTFLYPLKEEEEDNGEAGSVIDPAYEPWFGDIASQPNSIFGVSQYLYENFRDLKFMMLRRLRIAAFSGPTRPLSPNWYFVPTKRDPINGHIIDGYALDVDEPGAQRPKDAFAISRSSSARANSVIVPFMPALNRSLKRVLSSPLNRMISAIDGYLREGTSLPGYYRVFYEMHIDIKGENGQVARLYRRFYPHKVERDKDGKAKPVLVGYAIKTQAICFQINPDLIDRAVDKILEDEALRLLMRRNFAVYQTAPKSAEWEVFIQTQLERSEVAVDYWLHQVVTQNTGEPRLLDALLDQQALLHYYRTHRIVREGEVQQFGQFLTNYPSFFSVLNEILETAFKDTEEVRAFISSVVLHSLSSLLKNLVARLGGVGSDELVAYTDLPMLERVDSSTNPRILIMDTVEGGSGGIAQAFDRLDVGNDNNEGSLWWTLLTDLGKCPIGDGEALIKLVLTKASEEEIKKIQSNPNPDTLQNLLDSLKIPVSGEEAKRTLGRVLFKQIDVSDAQRVNPALILKELFAIQSLLEEEIPGTLNRRATIRYAVLHLNPEQHPYIANLRTALELGGVAGEDLDHELAQQLLGLYNNACQDGCPVCLSADSDIEHIYLAPRLNSRHALKKLREVLIEELPRDDCFAAADQLSTGEPTVIEENPGRLGNRLMPNIGIGVIPEVDDSGQAQSASTLVINAERAKDFVGKGDWEQSWSDSEYLPYETPGGQRVRSKDEYLIALQLEVNEDTAAFDYEPKLAYRDDKGRTRYIHPSFHLYEKNLYVEYWGRKDTNYLESRRFKEQIYNRPDVSRRIHILFLEPEDIENGTFMEKIRARIADDQR
jgi:superfamily II DNA/RNA helicase